ncbi:hypothetical protein [Luteimonas huabeiensis]|uniref:hypothetical protein n=1 Tax=Luteimonas huabeiensis TaxID=1244513 RepID=UPI0004631630|nr:hypothetical protein [Luteimonas huabeiensis]
MRPLRAALAMWCLAGAAFAQSAAVPELETHAERSGFAETGRYEEVERLCAAFAAGHPQAVRCESEPLDAGDPRLAVAWPQAWGPLRIPAAGGSSRRSRPQSPKQRA